MKRSRLWRTEQPPVGVAVEVWFWTEVIRATWDGRNWRDGDGRILLGVAYWRQV